MENGLDRDIHLRNSVDSSGSVPTASVQAGVKDVHTRVTESTGQAWRDLPLTREPRFASKSMDDGSAFISPHIFDCKHPSADFSGFIQEVMDSVEQKAQCGRLVLDLHSFENLLTDNVARLLQLMKKVTGKGGTLVLCNLSATARETLDHLKLTSRFIIQEGGAPISTPSSSTIVSTPPEGPSDDNAAGPGQNQAFVNEYAPPNLASVPK